MYLGTINRLPMSHVMKQDWQLYSFEAVNRGKAKHCTNIQYYGLLAAVGDRRKEDGSCQCVHFNVSICSYVICKVTANPGFYCIHIVIEIGLQYLCKSYFQQFYLGKYCVCDWPYHRLLIEVYDPMIQQFIFSYKPTYAYFA